MLPASSPPTLPQRPLDTDHLLAAHNKKKASFGPIIGIIIIIVLLGFGALYFWGASMNREEEQLPFIPEGNSTELGA